MNPTFEDYTKKIHSLSFEEMTRIHKELSAELEKNPEAKEIFDELLEKCIRYASFRANWSLWSRSEKLEQDNSRTSAHDMVILKLNQLARFMEAQGLQTEWRNCLGDLAEDPGYRKTIGDFACYLVFINSLHAR